MAEYCEDCDKLLDQCICGGNLCADCESEPKDCLCHVDSGHAQGLY